MNFVKLLRATLLAGTSICSILYVSAVFADHDVNHTEVMQTVPPAPSAQVTFHNYRFQPFNRWAFNNMGAPANVVMVPRAGAVATWQQKPDSRIEKLRFESADGQQSLEQLFQHNSADSLIVVKGDSILYEKYWGYADQHRAHIWFSMTKSLVTMALGTLLEEGKIDLNDSPADYIAELKGSAFERVTIQHVLDHTTALDFKENYTDPNSPFLKFYGPALNMAFIPGARDVQPGKDVIYGVHDFLSSYIKPDTALNPGDAFDYNSANADVVGWLVARLSGMPLQQFISDRIWSKIGAEHDAYMVVDRAFQPVATGGMNSTLRDAARFGRLILNNGVLDGQQILPSYLIDQALQPTAGDMERMANNPVYQNAPWQAYRNMWWLLDAERGEFAAVGIFGQLIYMDRKSGTVMVTFGSQKDAGFSVSKEAPRKLDALRKIARQLEE